MRRFLAALLSTSIASILLWTACATPGKEIALQPGDFALLEIQLQG
jgi:hypothetical protein